MSSEAAIDMALSRIATALNALFGSRSTLSADDLRIAIASERDTGGRMTLEQITPDMMRDRRNSVFENEAPHAYHCKFQTPAIRHLIGDGGNDEEGICDKTSVELNMCYHPLRERQILGVKNEARNRVVARSVIRALSQNPTGHFLRIEAAGVDKNARPLGTSNTLPDMIEMDNIVRWTQSWARENGGQAFAMATADHGYAFDI